MRSDVRLRREWKVRVQVDRKQTMKRWIVLLALAVIAMPGVVAAEGQGQARGRATAPGQQKKPAAAEAKPSPGAGPVVVVETAKGTFEFETYPNEAPKSVDHILTLVRRNFYNGLRISRVVRGQLVQFGDPLSRDMSKRDYWGTGGSGKPIGVAEISPKRKHLVGSVALAHPGNPRLADSQLYVMLIPQPKYDKDYTVIGRVIAGMDVVQKLQETDVIRRATIKGQAPAGLR
jgi:cyclophilin family peptidyl-prolyl cis-trans isomerase